MTVVEVFAYRPPGVTLSKRNNDPSEGPEREALLSVRTMKDTGKNFKDGVILVSNKIHSNDPKYKGISDLSKPPKKKKRKATTTTTPPSAPVTKKSKGKEEEEEEEEEKSLITRKKGDGKKRKTPHEQVAAAAAQFAKDVRDKRSKMKKRKKVVAKKPPPPLQEARLPGFADLFFQDLINNPRYGIEVEANDTPDSLFARYPEKLAWVIHFCKFINECSK